MSNHDERIADMTFASVHPLYQAKIEKKGRTKAELLQVIEWLTGYDEKKLQDLIEEKASFQKVLSGRYIKSECPPHHRRNLRLPYRRN